MCRSDFGPGRWCSLATSLRYFVDRRSEPTMTFSRVLSPQTTKRNRWATIRDMPFRICLLAMTLVLSGCSNSSDATDLARQTGCWGYFSSLQPANLNQGTQQERRDIARVIFENSLYSSDPLIVLGATNMLQAMKDEDADAYRDGLVTFITACQKAGLWKE